MDISSGTIVFGVTCPGSLMAELQEKDPDNVRNIKSFQTSFSKNLVTWQCHATCKDLNVVANFTKSIAALEHLSILNYETDTSILWPAIFYHGKSLRSLAVHTPPQKRPDVWTVSIVQEVADRLPQLRRLEMDISLEEGERCMNDEAQYQPFVSKTEISTLKCKETASTSGCLSAIARSLLPESSEPTNQLVLDKLTNMDKLESLLINVNLGDEASVFAEKHTWNAMGSISFPSINNDTCSCLAQQIFNEFHTKNPDSALEHLELRFPRRQWDDRAQFWTVAHSVHVRKDESKPMVQIEANWKEYLPQWPRDGILRDLSNEGYTEERKRWGRG